MKIWLILSLLLMAFGCIQGNTKPLRRVNISGDNTHRQETFSLKNEELVIEGTHTQNIYPKDNTDFLYRIETIYVADKDGYRAKYKLVIGPQGEFDVDVRLSASTLKSLVG